MKKINKNKKQTTGEETGHANDNTLPDNDADKTGTDMGADKTQPGGAKKGKGASKFDKPKREPNPDRTGIDIHSDKTKKENSSK